jgi:hypothetical protein
MHGSLREVILMEVSMLHLVGELALGYQGSLDLQELWSLPQNERYYGSILAILFKQNSKSLVLPLN